MNQTVIKIENLYKEYRLGSIGYATLREDFQRVIAEIQGKPDPNSIMAKANPNLIPRNHQIELAITAALNSDFDLFHRLNKALKSPYEKTLEYSDLEAIPTEEEEVLKTFCGT